MICPRASYGRQVRCCKGPYTLLTQGSDIFKLQGSELKSGRYPDAIVLDGAQLKSAQIHRSYNHSASALVHSRPCLLRYSPWRLHGAPTRQHKEYADSKGGA